MNSRRSLLTFALVALGVSVGWWGRSMLPDNRSKHSEEINPSANSSCPGGAAPLYWKAPMDPTYVRNDPGKSPMGMDLLPECPNSTGAAPAGAVVIDAATVQNIGVRTTPIVRQDLARSVRAVGRVAYDERRVAHVHTKVQGWIEKLFVEFVGQEVKRGQPLLEIYSPELVATQEELLLALRYRNSTKESPFEDVRGGGESLLNATKRRLALWDIPQRDIERLLETGEVKRTLTLYAPASGFITRLGVRSGMEVQPNSNLYTIADLSKVWVLADVYEYELPWLALGQMAKVELSYLPGPPMQGQLTYIAPFLDAKTRTVEVRLELDNTSRKLKPEMFGNVVIAGAPRSGVLAIPAAAVLHSGKRTLAVVALGQGRFEPRDIELGLDSGDGLLEVLSGLAEGEDVVISSQFLIDSESNLQEAVSKLLSATSEKKEAEKETELRRPPLPASRPLDHSMHMEPDTGDKAEKRAHEGHSIPGADGAPAAHDHSSMDKE